MDTFMLGFRYFVIDFVGGFLRWPIWWYTKGLVLMAKRSMEAVRQYARMLALGVWIKNIFVPMYGTRDWQSRIISFFMRLLQIIGRSFVLLIWIVVVMSLFIVYLTLPLVSLFFLVMGLVGGTVTL